MFILCLIVNQNFLSFSCNFTLFFSYFLLVFQTASHLRQLIDNIFSFPFNPYRSYISVCDKFTSEFYFEIYCQRNIYIFHILNLNLFKDIQNIFPWLNNCFLPLTSVFFPYLMGLYTRMTFYDRQPTFSRNPVKKRSSVSLKT